MNPTLKWSFAATVLATLGVQVLGESGTEVVQPAPRAPGVQGVHYEAGIGLSPEAAASSPAALLLPKPERAQDTSWAQSLLLAPATRLGAPVADPFHESVLPVPVAPPAPVVSSVLPPVPVVQPRAAAPAFGYRYVGRFTDPLGRTTFYLAKLDKELVAAPGLHLEDGFVIEAVSSDSIRFRHPLAAEPVDLPLPKKDLAP